MSSKVQESVPRRAFITVQALDRLIQLLRQTGFHVIGPRVDQSAIVLGELHSVEDLPVGWSDAQSPARYQLTKTGKSTYFAYNLGPHTWKQFLFPSQQTVATAQRTEQGWEFITPDSSPPRFAFLGVRACELSGIAIQDRVFLDGDYVDPEYQRRRQAALIIAVNCTQAASSCFCTSMDSGPRCKSGFDLALTEIAGGFVIECGSERGEKWFQTIDQRPVTSNDLELAERARQQAVEQITKRMDTEGIRDLLLNNLEHPRWDDVAGRCLSCTNCTMVCPTCFCSTVTDVTDLEGSHVDRQRSWDSCFNFDFSYLVGGPVRHDRRSRYRQWLTHKLASWWDQFDSSGCVGCGRCITWCPVGIDLTEEVAAIRQTPSTRRTLPVIQPTEPRVCKLGERT